MRRFYSYFVPWGRQSAINASEEQVKTALRAKYADRLATARFPRRCWLYYRMRQDLRREMARIAPQSALYSSCLAQPSLDFGQLGPAPTRQASQNRS